MTSVVKRRVKSMGEGKFSPLTTPIPLNRQSPNTAHVIMSSISPHKPHLVKIAPGVTSPHIAKFTTHFLKISSLYAKSFHGPRACGRGGHTLLAWHAPGEFVIGRRWDATRAATHSGSVVVLHS